MLCNNIPCLFSFLTKTWVYLSKYLRQQKPEKGEEQEEEPSWEDKLLHGMYHQEIEEVADIKKSNWWLNKAGLKDSTEPLTMAAQEKALNLQYNLFSLIYCCLFTHLFFIYYHHVSPLCLESMILSAFLFLLLYFPTSLQHLQSNLMPKMTICGMITAAFVASLQ